MSEPENLTLQVLREMRGGLAEVKTIMEDRFSRLEDRFNRVDDQMATMSIYVTNAVGWNAETRIETAD